MKSVTQSDFRSLNASTEMNQTKVQVINDAKKVTKILITIVLEKVSGSGVKVGYSEIIHISENDQNLFLFRHNSL